MKPPLPHYENLPEPPKLGIDIGFLSGKLVTTVNVGGHAVEVISVRLDSAARPPQMPTWLFLRVGPHLTMLLHTCGDGSGWREVDEGVPDFTIRCGSSAQAHMAFTCLRCTSIQRMRPNGDIEWPEMTGRGFPCE